MILRILGGVLLVLVLIAAFLAWSHRPLSPETLEARYMSDEDRFVDAAGQTWRVRESGPEGADALVLIHGFSHSLESFEPLADRLDADYRVIRFDLPGHALTGPRSDAAYSNEATTEQVTALLDEIAPDTFAIGGNSLGGLVAWRYAALAPERVAGLVLVSTGGFPNLGVGDDPLEAPAAVQTYLRFAPEAGVRQAMETLYAEPERLTDDQLQRIRDMMRARGVGDALIERIAQFTLPNPEPILSQISAPTLIIWGAQDAMIPAEHGARFQGALPDAELLIIEDAGHMAQVETPDRAAEAVRRFLEDEVFGAE